MKQKFTVLKLIDSTSADFNELCAEEVHSIIPVKDKLGNPMLLVNFYDSEFCMDASLFCKEIEFINNEIEL